MIILQRNLKLQKKLVKFPSSDESTFTNNELELSVPYEQLMNEYNTVSNVKAAT